MNPSSGISGPSAVSTWDLLLTLGFVQDQSVIADQPPGISFDFGNFKLEASRLTNRWNVPTVLLGGVMASKRTSALVNAELALQVESREQGLAFVAWCLDNSAGGRFQLTIEPPWLAEGRRYRHLLPWERKRAAYLARPHCYVQRDWARVALKKLAAQVTNLNNDAPVTFSFDGTVLMIRCPGKVNAMSAEGLPWTESYSITAGALRKLPKRLMSEMVEVSVWDSALIIGRWRYAGVSSAPIPVKN
jgi:hypothetical protein